MSPRCDLIVWFHDDETVKGFQFCYDKDDVEHALTWIDDLGFNHMRVDTGCALERGGTPLLMANGVFDPSRILEIFKGECEWVPAEFVELVSSKLKEIARTA
jgi:hypothetical protein